MGCNFGVSGARWKTPEYELEHALKMLEMHMVNHVGQAGQLQRHPDGGVGQKVEKFPRPTLSKGLSQDKFVHFERQWKRYKRSSNLKDAQQIRDQLMACCQDELAEDLGNLFGEQLDMKEETELLEEMRRLAVESQNHLVNIEGYVRWYKIETNL